MKKISYQYCVKANHGTEETPKYVDTFLDKTLSCYTDVEYERNLLLAQQEAYNGVYTIEDDGQPNPDEVPNQWDVLEAQVTYTAMMTDTLLEG